MRPATDSSTTNPPVQRAASIRVAMVPPVVLSAVTVPGFAFSIIQPAISCGCISFADATWLLTALALVLVMTAGPAFFYGCMFSLGGIGSVVTSGTRLLPIFKNMLRHLRLAAADEAPGADLSQHGEKL